MIFDLMKRLYYGFISPPTATLSTESKPIKFGILGAANIAPEALIKPAKSHAEVLVYGVAARDRSRAESYAKKYGIEKVYAHYQEMLDDPEIEAIYNPLPNGLHYEWTMKALLAGKHVLLEKPAADTTDETRQMFDLAEKKGLVLLEAFHYRFHPAMQRVKAILNSGELGKVKSIHVALAVPSFLFKPADIRFDFKLGGGAMMDMGCYTLNCARYLASSNPTAISSVKIHPFIPPSSPADFKPDVDRGLTAILEFPNDITASIFVDLALPPTWGIFPKISLSQVTAKVDCEGGSIELWPFIAPSPYSSLSVTTKQTGKKRTEKVYTFADAKMEGKGEAWWMSYRYQLEAFVDKVKGRTPQTWLTKEDSVGNAEWIEKMYEKSGLGVRPKSEYVPPPL